MRRISMLLGIVIVMSLVACTNDTIQNEQQVKTDSGRSDYLHVKVENNEKDVQDMTIKITTGNESFTATLEDNETAKAFKEILPLTINMEDINGNEKYCVLSENISKDSAKKIGTIYAGEIMCWGNSGLVLFYDTFTTQYNYVKIGKIDNVDGYAEALGRGNVQLTIQ
ncbi:cyclophilin-like fold protein [Clostridium butyricum]|uniref:cyclophilin-like fold protein n=1 Tax=Clostridium butyricum TaxID=1492 RepID=UPI0022E6ABFE|nr:cyclophilin-like fold protein [Clostridium butyricum]